ncbi:MAG: GGDEF domain-containing protein, partial [Campylobacter sp.]|nr:GGDEF domain-containing protein [Campylobacter sp.]
DFEVKLNDSKRAIKSLKDQIRELQVQLEKSAKEAQNDFLTGLYTKRALEAQLDRVEEDYINKDIEYCICFFDIDHFKHINDTYGQSAGNVILAKIGGILHKMSRQIDVVARYGGEEFVAILPLCDLKQAQKYANEILHNVHSYEFVYKQSKFNVTISCGIASRTQTKSRISCMEKANEMLYAAKEAGRNCVKVLES